MESYEADVRRLVSEGLSHAEISFYLREREPNSRGLSELSVRRFCAQRQIVRSVGHGYGRRTLHRFLRSQGIHISQRRVGCALSRIAPRPAQNRRARVYRLMNPVPYLAEYYGHKLHNCSVPFIILPLSVTCTCNENIVASQPSCGKAVG